jgi:5,6-dimethylbenzimidazole synthase
VSIIDPVLLREVLGIPARVIPIAYLCLGYVHEAYVRPELEVKGWRKRLPAEEVLNFESWGQTSADEPLLALMQAAMANCAPDGLARPDASEHHAAPAGG